jgi:4-amino-4-deoxy-L-arabinose transferase-like glycosyltransferase
VHATSSVAASSDLGASVPATLSERVARQHWIWWLTGISVVGFAIRLASVIGRLHRPIGGDGYYYFYAAKLLVHGHGFINPFYYNGFYGMAPHTVVQTAEWDPGFVFVMAVPEALGLHSYLDARIWMCLLGVAAIIMAAFAGREIGGPRLGRRVGLIAAGAMAIYPNVWMNTELAMSEAFTPFLVAWLLWLLYRFWRAPSMRRAAWIGVAFGVSILCRDEFSILLLLGFVPLALLARSFPLRRRAAFAGVAVGLVVAILLPWVAYNMSRFDKPVFIRDGLGSTLAASNCKDTYQGNGIGYWSVNCILHAHYDQGADESVQASQLQASATRFIKAHLSLLPAVEFARLGRTFGFFRPAQQVHLDATIEARPYHWTMIGLASYYLLFALSLAGTVALRRRRVPFFPLWVVGFGVALAVMISFGQTRYRTTFEVSLCLMAAVAVESAARHLRARLGSPTALPTGPGHAHGPHDAPSSAPSG